MWRCCANIIVRCGGGAVGLGPVGHTWPRTLTFLDAGPGHLDVLWELACRLRPSQQQQTVDCLRNPPPPLPVSLVLSLPSSLVSIQFCITIIVI